MTTSGAAPARHVAATFARRLGRMAHIPPRELATVLHVVAVLAVVELLVRWVPLPRLSRVLGVRVDLGPERTGIEPLPTDELPERPRRRLACTRRVADAWPFSRGPCLRRALVGGHLVRDLDPAVRIGIAEVDGRVLAHAWLEIDDRPLESVAGFTPFTRPTGTGVTS